MPQSDEPGRAGRPSLLPEQPGQPAASDDQSILSKLDGRASPAGGARKSGRMGAAAGIAAVVVLAGGAWAWSIQDSAEPIAPPVVIATAAPPIVPAPAAAPASEPAPAPAEQPEAPATPPETEVSAATILENVPDATVPVAAAGVAAAALVGTKAAAVSPSAPSGKDELAALLDKPAASADADKPKAKPVPKKKAEQAKVARKDKAREKKKTAVAAAPKKKPAAKPAPAPDSDVALLAALLAHSKASAKPHSGKTAAEYKRCGTLGSAADTSKCRERLCEGSAKARAECKTLGATGTSG